MGLRCIEDSLLRSLRPDQIIYVPHPLLQVKIQHLQLHLAALNLGHIQYIINQRKKIV